MIKKFFHFVCVLIAGSCFTLLLTLVYQQALLYAVRINIFAPATYEMFLQFWNNGGVLKSNDVLLLLGLFTFFPLCLWGWFRLYKYKFMNLVLVPLNWTLNWGTGRMAEDVNIKNLKIEEKKTLDQIVQERIELENKKLEQSESDNFRKKIIEKIEKEIK